MTLQTLCFMVVALALGPLQAETIFIETENFDVSADGGWVSNHCRTASSVTALHGASGDPAGVARTTVKLKADGLYRIWVHYMHFDHIRGPFDLSVFSGDKRLVVHSFDIEPSPNSPGRGGCLWDHVDVELPASEIRLELSKHGQKNCSGYTRMVDCVLLTTDREMTPDHRDFGPQTYLRVTIGDIKGPPVYINVFADHYRAPWYSYHHLSKAGAGDGLAPDKKNLLQTGEQTPWCNITRMLYQDSGAILNMTSRYTYHTRPDRMKARYEFATAPDDSAIVRTMDVEAQPNGLVIVMPPDLVSETNRSRLGRDRDFAEKTGRLADAYDWPKIGKKPSLFPFFVAAQIGGYGTPPDQAVIDRERKTLDYFGFANWTRTRLKAGTWRTISNSYCRPDIPAITNVAAARATELTAAGKRPEDIVYCMLMDEPTGQSLDFMAQDVAYRDAFRDWLKSKRLTPAELLVADWKAVVPVTAQQRETAPALYYFSQRFRTQALGDFMAVQRRAFEAACNGSFPVNVNFSDGATYHANFYSQGVDYFELLAGEGQNAIWGEDWANGSSSYQCGAYNVDLMRAAARERRQVIGHYLIAYAGRRSFDIKLKAAGNVARGVKMCTSFNYGVYWGSHEGGAAWSSSVWQNRPEIWYAHAEVLREIGGVEEMLLPAMPAPAEVAILYASSSDIWTIGANLAYGFNRMHTWMALTHAQIPVDFVSEAQAAAGALDGYRVCYLSGPNLTRAAATRLAQWVRGGGTLVVDAAGASRDEYNRPLPTLAEVLPAQRGDAVVLQSFGGSGHYLSTLQPKDYVTISANKTAINVLSVRQSLTPRPDAVVLAAYDDATASWVRGTTGKGTVHVLGFLPALDYIHHALVARQALVEQAKETAPAAIDGPDASRDGKPMIAKTLSVADRFRLEASANPWDFSHVVREAIVEPARTSGIDPPIVCSVPLIDAVYMTCAQGIIIPLANYTLHPLDQVEFSVRVEQPPVRVESVHQGKIDFRRVTKNGRERIVFSLPLDSTDFITIRW